MRKLIAVLAVLFSVAACTPKQVAELRNHSTVTTEDIQISKTVNVLEANGPPGIVLSFLQSAFVLHNQPFLRCTRAHESDTAGGYQAYNRGGPYFGAYQYLQRTWDFAAAHYGSPQYVGVDPRQVPGYFQDLVTFGYYQAGGNGPWGGRC